MVHFDPISDAVRRRIAQDAIPLISSHDVRTLGAPGQSLQLGASLQEEFMPLQDVGSESAVPKRTGQLLSLLRVPAEHATLGAGPGGRSRLFGHVLAGADLKSDALSDEVHDWSVKAVSASDLSARIQSAVDWIGANVPGDPLVRVLSVPAYQITALTLYSGTNLIGVVALPLPGDDAFDPHRVYSMSEFKDRLRQLPNAAGLSVP